MLLFPYSWSIREDEIVAFCFDRNSAVVCLRILHFEPFLYVRVPRGWSTTRANELARTLRTRFPQGIVATRIESRTGLYANALDPPNVYVRVTFENEDARRRFSYQLREPIRMGGIRYNLSVFEANAPAPLQLVATRGIAMSDWFECAQSVPVDSTARISNVAQELRCSATAIQPAGAAAPDFAPAPLLLSFDIEVYTHDVNVFCQATHPEDKIFQISGVFGRHGTPEAEWQQYLLTLGEPEPHWIQDGIQVRSYATEVQLLLGFVDLIRELNPQILMGWNIFKFDNKYLTDRARLLHVFNDFARQGCNNEVAPERRMSWSSSAFQNQESYFLDSFGRITIDVMTLVQRDYTQFENYKLNTVAAAFLGAEKDPLTHYDIAMCCRRGLAGDGQALALVGNYCVKDSLLVLQIFERQRFWYSLISMSKICSVPIINLFLNGQQFKVFSQVYRYCFDHHMVCESGGYEGTRDKFKGAHVLEACPGLYENIVSFDFASLYPSIIISHNIDYTTFVPESNTQVSDADCHVVEWEEHVNCGCPGAEEDAKQPETCKRFRYRWLRAPAGVLPTIIQNLLSARKETRAQLAQYTEGTPAWLRLEKIQLAYKVSANSMYGALNPREGGYVPFPPGAQTITAVGRISLERVSEIITRDFGGQVIYGDTDSNYVRFPSIPPAELIAYCERVSRETSAHFLRPMKLEFEGKLFERFLLLSKKRYIYRVKGKIGSKGVLLKRRDNSQVVRSIYQQFVERMFSHSEPAELEHFLFESIQEMGARNLRDYELTKSIKTIDAFPVRPGDRTGKIRYGDYILPEATPEKMAKKGAATTEEFYRASLGGHVRLALRMRARGQSIENGSRLNFVYTRRGGLTADAGLKMEEAEFFALFYEHSFIDTFYYLKLLLKPVQELFVAYRGEDYSLLFKQLQDREKTRQKLLEEFKQLNAPVITFVLE